MKIFLLILSMSCLIMSNSNAADKSMYVGLKYSQLNLDRSTIAGYDLDNFAPTEFNFYDVYVGYNTQSKIFVELGYVKSDKETKSGTQTVNSISITGTNVAQEFDGYRFGVGYKHKMNENFLIKGFSNLYVIDVTTSGSLVASSGSATATAKLAGTKSETWIDAGLGLAYVVDKIEFGLSYSRAVGQMDEIDSANGISAYISYKIN